MIRRQVLEVAVNGTEAEGLALQRKLVGLCRDWLAPALEEAFARASPVGEHWSIDRLEIDAGRFTLDLPERDFVSAVQSAVEKQIRDHAPGGVTRTRRERSDAPGPPIGPGLLPVAPPDEQDGAGFQRRTEAQAAQDAFVHFLATGMLPWWFRLPPDMTLEAVLSATWEGEGIAAFAVAYTIQASSTARLRLVRQFSAPFLATLLQKLSPQTAQATQIIADQLMQQPDMFGQQLWLAAFEAAVSHRPVSVETLLADLSRLAPAEVWRPSVPKAAPGNKSGSQAASAHPSLSIPQTLIRADRHPLADPVPRIDLDEGVFVDCAGLVLLHPFLPAILERLGMARAGRLILPDRALALLHGLATGQTCAPEYALVLPKLLCGLPLDEPVGAPVTLTENEIAEAGNLLGAVIGHWAALGETSPDALRGTFLMRPGKLSRRGDDDLLQVEQQSFDVLLDRLPWGIGMVQLPWMARMLWVEWRM
jgi:hypothetical protein